MLLKSQEIVIKSKDFFKEKLILLYGENQDLINDLNQQIISKFIEQERAGKPCQDSWRNRFLSVETCVNCG